MEHLIPIRSQDNLVLINEKEKKISSCGFCRFCELQCGKKKKKKAKSEASSWICQRTEKAVKQECGDDSNCN